MIYFMLLILAIAGFIYYTIWTFTDHDAQRKKQQQEADQRQYTNTRVDYSNISEEEFRSLLLQKLQNVIFRSTAWH